MKKYQRPEWAMAAFEAWDLLMASNENETPGDNVDANNLIINNI